ncbi:glycoside hydrolase family 25 protein [Dietzia psychralcaliphila]|uniref:Hydrolase n=1 Tax=Dietzia psychralcaliphila TaxID=139021 RepID=A0AAD0JW59_9ACTN|nr:glycoside hydrolase family 25 protein [Dietzia psychralcaliphila]AWH96668.1 hydrolase [Dietzia psychralcaliphila]PTM89278.1 GH25 family lysozyme M1 (1,4-beta-N-acetylmuramidase) [Dietzia psychralcaliphila]
MTPVGQSAHRALLPRLIVALASAAALALGLLVVVISPRADAVVPLSPAFDGLARGIDSSSWQHPHGAPVDWHAAAASGQSFAFIKATEGTGPANRYYEADVEQARASGMAVGSYHKARPAMDPSVQARAFAARLQSVGGQQLPPVLDIETDEGKNPEELIEWTRVFLTELQHLTGRTPIIYTYRFFWIDRMANTTQFSEYPLWLAEYGVPEPTLPVIGGWTEWSFWQNSETGAVPGFTGPVDLNVFAGTHEDIWAWVGPVTPGEAPAHEPAPAPAPEPVPDPAPEPAPGPGGPAEPVTVAIPEGIPTPDGVRLPETVTVPAHMLDQIPPEFR